MGLLKQALALTDQADLIILANIETIQDQKQPATSSAVAALIGGAPVGEIHKRMIRLKTLQALELDGIHPGSLALTELGVELLREEMPGWSPSGRETRRREAAMRRALNGLAH